MSGEQIVVSADGQGDYAETGVDSGGGPEGGPPQMAGALQAPGADVM